jgi:hypothetical protein
MRTARESMLSLRVWAGTEETALRFACLLLPMLEAWRGRAVNAAAIAQPSMEHRAVIAVEDVRRWSFTDALQRAEALVHRGVNTILLSEAFLDWTTKREAINDELYELEGYLQDKHIDVITVETYNNAGRERFTRHFGEVPEWRPVRLIPLMEFITSASTEGGLLSPVGGDPYFMVDPCATDMKGREEVKALVGVQTWSFERFAAHWPGFGFPFRQVVTRRGCDLVPAGPMAALLDLPEH